jgi:hypothetical protein
MAGFTFYLGTDRPRWLGAVPVPLFVSRRVLARRRELPPVTAGWALDSGAFTELKDHGRWTVTPAEYAGEVRRWHSQAGGMHFASPQDWMCEPAVIAGGTFGRERFVGTGLSVPEHQRRTTDNLLELRSLAPDLPWIPVLQGWQEADYLRHADQYAALGVDLTREPLVGVGSVCRRQDTRTAERLVCRLARDGLRLHLFGYKLRGLALSARFLASSDSMAWCYHASRRPPLPGCPHRNCAHCLRYALWWREKALKAVERGSRRAYQETLW